MTTTTDTVTRTPARIQLQRTKGWRLPEGAVSVARPTRWGNPFKLGTPSGLARVPAVHYPDKPWEHEARISADGMRHDYHHPGGRVTVCHVRYMTADEVMQCYRALLYGGGWPLSWADVGGYYRTADEARAELRGLDLACWCPLDSPCHADVLLEVANAGDPVDVWNTHHPVGTLVRYWPGERTGDSHLSRTRSRAWLIGGHTPVVMVDGCPGGIALTHVDPVEDTDH